MQQSVLGTLDSCKIVGYTPVMLFQHRDDWVRVLGICSLVG